MRTFLFLLGWILLALTNVGAAAPEASVHQTVSVVNPTPYDLKGHVFRIPMKDLFPRLPAGRLVAVTVMDGVSSQALTSVTCVVNNTSQASLLGDELVLLADVSPFGRRKLVVSSEGSASPSPQPPMTWPMSMGAPEAMQCQVLQDGSVVNLKYQATAAFGLENRLIIPDKHVVRDSRRFGDQRLSVLDLNYELYPGIQLARRIYVSPREIKIRECLSNTDPDSKAIAPDSHYRQQIHESILDPKLRSTTFSAGYFGGVVDLEKGEHFGDLLKGRKPDSIFPMGKYAFGFRDDQGGFAAIQENNHPEWIPGFFCSRGSGQVVSIMGPERMMGQERREWEINVVHFTGGLEGFKTGIQCRRNYKSFGSPRVLVKEDEMRGTADRAAALIAEMLKIGLPRECYEKIQATLNDVKRESDPLGKFQRLDAVDVPGEIEKLLQQEALPPTPSPAKERRAAISKRLRQVYLSAAQWDYCMGRFERVSERLRKAADLGAAAAAAAAFQSSPQLANAGNWTGWQPYVTIYLDLAHDVFPHDLTKQVKRCGLDVLQLSLHWGYPDLFGYCQAQKDQQNFLDYDLFCDMAAQQQSTFNVRVLAHPPKYVKEKWPNGKRLEEDNELNISSAMLGRETDFMKLYDEQFVIPHIKRYASKNVRCWDNGCEPMFYGGRGITDDLMKTAFLNWLTARYSKDISRVNQAWKTNFENFEKLAIPAKTVDAGWYDVVIFKCECLTEALKIRAEKIRRLDPYQAPVGQSWCSNVMGPALINNGWGYDPWISASAQLGETVQCDLYFHHSFPHDLLRTYEQYCGGGMRPVDSLEGNNYGPMGNDRIRGRWNVEDPDQLRCTIFSTMMFGMKGFCYYNFAGFNYWDVLDADYTMSPHSLSASRTAQEYKEWSGVLKDLKPITSLGMYYPRAGFINGTPTDIEVYEGVFFALTNNGYQPALFSATDADAALRRFKLVLVPQSRSIEQGMLVKLADYVRKGGKVVYVGELPTTNEYKQPLPEELLRTLFGVVPSRATVVTPAAFQNAGAEIKLPTGMAFKQYETSGAGVLTRGARDEALCYQQALGEGTVFFIPAPVCTGYLDGMDVVKLDGPWKFKLGAQWPITMGAVTDRFADDHTDRGMGEKWYRPECDDAEWPPINVPGDWQSQGYDCAGWGWYRRRLTLDRSLADKKILFCGETVADKAWIYVNGELVKTTTGWNDKFAVDVTRFLKFGQENTLAMRVRCKNYMGGARGTVKLVSPDLVRSDWTLLESALMAAGNQAETGASLPQLLKMLMQDAQGQKYLLVANYSPTPFKGTILLNRTHLSGARQAESLFTPFRQELRASAKAGFAEIPIQLERYDVAIFALVK